MSNQSAVAYRAMLRPPTFVSRCLMTGFRLSERATASRRRWTVSPTNRLLSAGTSSARVLLRAASRELGQKFDRAGAQACRRDAARDRASAPRRSRARRAAAGSALSPGPRPSRHSGHASAVATKTRSGWVLPANGMRQASDEGLLGAVIGVLAPRQIAEPACGPMPTPRRVREVAKERRGPLLQQIAVEAKPALAPANDHIAGDQRIRDPLLCRNEPIGVALAQPKSGKDDAVAAPRR